MENILMSLKIFLNGKIKNKWINDDGISVYIRRSKRVPPWNSRELLNCLDFASITIHDTGKGIFTNLLNATLDLAGIHSIPLFMVENILEQRFLSFLVRQGGIATHGITPSVYFDVTQKTRWLG